MAHDSSGNPLDYGFINYTTEQSGQRAIAQMNGKQLGGQVIKVSHYISREEYKKNHFTNLYVKHFPNEWGEQEVAELFAPFGEITSMCVSDGTRGRNCAFVNFKESAQAHQAIEHLHGKHDFCPSATINKDAVGLLYVQRAQNRDERFEQLEREKNPNGEKLTLCIKNLDESVSEEALFFLFRKYGPLASSKVLLDEYGRSKGLGFVRFKHEADAKKAKFALHNRMHKGKMMHVEVFKKQDFQPQPEKKVFEDAASGPDYYPENQPIQQQFKGASSCPELYPQYAPLPQQWKGSPSWPERNPQYPPFPQHWKGSPSWPDRYPQYPPSLQRFKGAPSWPLPQQFKGAAFDQHFKSAPRRPRQYREHPPLHQLLEGSPRGPEDAPPWSEQHRQDPPFYKPIEDGPEQRFSPLMRKLLQVVHPSMHERLLGVRLDSNPRSDKTTN